MMKYKAAFFMLMLVLLWSFPAAAFDTDTIYKSKARIEAAKSKRRMFVPPIVIKTSPTALLTGGVVPYTAEYRLMVEMTSGRRQSEQLAVSYLGKSLIIKAIEDSLQLHTNDIYKMTGWRIQYAHKFYWIGRRKYAPYGVYFAPLISYSEAHISIGLQRYYEHVYYDFRHFNINGIIGVQAGKIGRLTIDFYAGLGYKTNKVFYHTSSSTSTRYDTYDFGTLYNSHFNAVAGINVGYSF